MSGNATGGTLGPRDVTTGLSEAVIERKGSTVSGADNSEIRMVAHESHYAVAENEPSCEAEVVTSCVPGTDEFGELSRSLDSRSLGYRTAKRAFDIVFSALVVAVGLIPCAILSIVIAADIKGSPIYSQERVGRYGKPFRIYKFRSMFADADNVEKYFTPEQLIEWKRERKVENDPRITGLGRILRKTSIDELPQFINVLAGQISVIGPRPITYDELSEFGENAAILCSVPGGITGKWQSTERNNATFESGERQAIELNYVRHASVMEDLGVFFATFGVMFGKNRQC